ncbi:NACHT, LRR and PYD domains-containing protein 1b allele 2-like [Morone saxatilis]|uniref:NACHT, LRR and PYD domains-containing protein 1b allele 2-like n=1 Tax=Morone saxatilis TaxID=34816 RepID=UPI0015E1C13E|nr:NACHT, LRR and PYD domains-containing protein 1b allele 2-like [Morone saxatilis]
MLAGFDSPGESAAKKEAAAGPPWLQLHEPQNAPACQFDFPGRSECEALSCSRPQDEFPVEVFRGMCHASAAYLIHDLNTENGWVLESVSHSLKVSARAAVRKILFETLNGLSFKELEKFKFLLQFTYFQKSLPQISERQMLFAHSAEELVDLMVENLVENQQSVEVTKEVFMDMDRTDLVQRLSETSSGLKEGPSGSLELKGCGSSTQDSSDWTKLEPEVNSTDADEAPFYSLQTEAGKFECSVSGLRWLCKEKVSFKYQFCSWEEHIERMESIQYMPAGPLIDITVSAGRLDEVYLPHWICTGKWT